MKKLAFALVGVAAVLSTACAQGVKNTHVAKEQASIKEAVTVGTASEQDVGAPTPQVVDWDGRWHGVIPCASEACIEVDLVFNKDATFWMRETYLGPENKSMLTKGTVSWDESTRVLTLNATDSKQQLLFAEGSAVYLDANGNPMPEYMLHKQAEYRAHGQQLILPLQSIRVEGNQVSFKGLLNFNEQQEGGFKSVKGEAVIDCAKKHVTFKDASYYPQTDALGERIVNVSQLVRGGWRLGDSAEESVVVQVAETFCPSL